MGLSWQPQFSFFDVRGAILTEARDRGILQGYRWGEAQLTLRLGDYEAVTCRAAGADIYGLSPTVSDEELRQRTDFILELLNPNDISVTSATFMFILPIDLEYEEARRQFSENLAGELLPDAEPIDSAVLLDGMHSDAGRTFQVEYGIVNRSEVRARLRGLGRVELGPSSMQLEPDSSAAPDCAMFLHWGWYGDDLHERRLVDRSASGPYWGWLVDVSEALSDRIIIRHGLGSFERGKEEA